MNFETPLLKGILLKRYKRFLADVELPSGEIITAHCTNTGSMKGVLEPPQKAWVSKSNNPKRKLQYTLEFLEHNNVMVGVNTMNPNRLVKEFIVHTLIKELPPYEQLLTEQKYGENSRIDILLIDKDNKYTYVEVKNVSLTDNNGTALFPDSVTERGTKHLKELIEMKKQGHGAVMLYLSQRPDVHTFAPAEGIDPVYAEHVKLAKQHGVELLAFHTINSTTEITLGRQLTIEL